MSIATSTRTTRHTSLTEVLDYSVLDLWSDSGPNVAGLMNLSRSSVYARAKDGTIPTIRLGPRRLVCPVPALLTMLGVER